MRLRLEALLLLETVLSEAEGRLAGGGSAWAAAQQHSLAAVQEDLRQVLPAAARETLTAFADYAVVFSSSCKICL